MSRRNRVLAMMTPNSTKNMKTNLLSAAKTFRNTAGQKLKNLGRGATQKVKNLGQAIKNKYSQFELESKLENNFAYRPNVAGMKPGAASRNLLKVANKQQQNKKAAEERRMRNRNNGWSSGNKYQAASMTSSLFF